MLTGIGKPMPPDAKGQDIWQYTTLGMEFVITFGVIVAGGYWLDRWLGTLPVWTLIAAGLGFAGAMYRLVRSARQLDRRSQDKERPGDAGGPKKSD